MKAFLIRKIMNSKIYETLEFGKITTQLANLAITEGAKQKAKQLEAKTTVTEVKFQIEQTLALSDLNRVKGQLPIVNYRDVTPATKRLKIDADLNKAELGNILRILRIATEVKRFLDNTLELDLGAIAELQAEIVIPELLYRRLKESMEDDGEILDTASRELTRIRKAYDRLELGLKQKMDGYIHGGQAKYLSEQIVTIRDGRYVIPVRQEYRNKFGGVVHDQSASGQTLFIEPQAVVNLNNQLQENLAEEKAEIKRILEELSSLAGQVIPELLSTSNALVELDFLQAKSRLAREMHATEPIVNEQKQVRLLQAKHPLIDPHKVVANDILLGIDFDTMLITGPNTGGKTITLKTLGLLQLMAQSGLFIPAREKSQVGVFTEIFADIGDEQSIEQSLSTFSSHMDNIIKIMDNFDENSLVLFDELGAGTDPEEGAALAIAILDAIRKRSSKIVITTHYPSLKLYGYDRKRTTNASMEFDLKTLSPTYRLQIGIPGHSNAFAIVQRLGMRKPVVDDARSLISEDDSDINQMIAKLNFQTKSATKARRMFEENLKQTGELKDELQQALDVYHQRVDAQMAAAQVKSDEIIKKAQTKSDKIIRDLREAQKNGANTVKDDRLIAAKGALNQLRDDNLSTNKVLRREKKKHSVKVGDEVKVISYGQYGTVMKKLSEHEFEIQMGMIKAKIDDRDLEKVTGQPKTVTRKISRNISHTSPLRRSSASATLDLRGQRYDEAMENLDRYVDGALLSGLDNVTIVHGIGTGAIRQGVTQYLKSNRHVKKFGYAPEGGGGSGATIVEFK